MKYSLRYRIIYSLILGGCLFVLESVMYKLVLDNPYWLSTSLLWSISWGIGFFVSKTLANYVNGIGRVIGIEAVIIAALLVLLLFIFGVIFEVVEFGKIIFFVMFSFCMSLIINNDW